MRHEVSVHSRQGTHNDLPHKTGGDFVNFCKCPWDIPLDNLGWSLSTAQIKRCLLDCFEDRGANTGKRGRTQQRDKECCVHSGAAAAQ